MAIILHTESINGFIKQMQLKKNMTANNDIIVLFYTPLKFVRCCMWFEVVKGMITFC